MKKRLNVNTQNLDSLSWGQMIAGKVLEQVNQLQSLARMAALRPSGEGQEPEQQCADLRRTMALLERQLEFIQSGVIDVLGIMAHHDPAQKASRASVVALGQ